MERRTPEELDDPDDPEEPLLDAWLPDEPEALVLAVEPDEPEAVLAPEELALLELAPAAVELEVLAVVLDAEEPLVVDEPAGGLDFPHATFKPTNRPSDAKSALDE